MLGAIARGLAVLALMQAALPAMAAEPAEPAIVLQLPPGMSVDQMRGLLVELESKGATAKPATVVTTTPTEPVARRIMNRLCITVPRTPELLDLPVRWHDAVAEGGWSATRFWLVLAGILVGGLVLERLARHVVPVLGRASPAVTETRLPAAFARHLLSLAVGLVVFVLTLKVGEGLLPTARPLLQETAEQVTKSAIVWRVAVALLVLFIAPADPAARPLYLDDVGARRVARWIGLYLFSAMLFVLMLWLVGRLGDNDLALDVAFGFGILVTLYRVAMAFGLRSTVAGAILAAGGGAPGVVRRWVALLWHWLYIAFAITVTAFAVEQYAVANNADAGRAASALQSVVIGMALAWAAKHRFIADIRAQRPGVWWHQVASHAVDMVVLIGGLAWLATLWGFALFDPEAPGITQTVLRPLFRASVTLAVAWAVWSAIDGFLRERSPQQAYGPVGEEGSADTGMTRLATLLPLLRNVFAIAIFFLGSVLALGRSEERRVGKEC